MSSRWIKQGLLLYWAVWTAIVFATNLTDALVAVAAVMDVRFWKLFRDDKGSHHLPDAHRAAQ